MLGIDTSGKTASAALYEDGIMLGQTSVYTSKTHSQVILPMVKKIMSDCGREQTYPYLPVRVLIPESE